MKFAVIFVLVVVCVLGAVNGVPVEEDGHGQVVSRSRRATCDLLSIDTKIGSLNHAACAGHCLVKGFKGGRCIDGVCNCRH